MSVVKKVLITTLLNRLVERKLHEDAVVTLPSVLKLLRSCTGTSVAPPSPIPIFDDAEGTDQFVLQASQALLSAVVLRAPPADRRAHPRRHPLYQARPGPPWRKGIPTPPPTSASSLPSSPPAMAASTRPWRRRGSTRPNSRRTTCCT